MISTVSTVCQEVHLWVRSFVVTMSVYMILIHLLAVNAITYLVSQISKAL